MNRQSNPKRAFYSQKANAKRRNIEWDLTFDEWWELWEPYFHMRGHGKNGLCMGRNGDAGPYKVGNVYITTNLGNLLDRKHSQKAKEQRQLEIDRGGCPQGYGWGHSTALAWHQSGKSESMKQKDKQNEYMVCFLDGDVLE